MCGSARWACGQTGEFCEVEFMSANELLHEIEALPEDQRRWLMERLFQMAENEQRSWARFSTNELASQYAAEDSVYDED